MVNNFHYGTKDSNLFRKILDCFTFVLIITTIIALVMLIYHAPETARELNNDNHFLENINFLAVAFSAAVVALTLFLTYRQITLSLNYNKAKLVYDFLKDAEALHETYISLKEKYDDKVDDHFSPYVFQHYYNIFQVSQSVHLGSFMEIVEKDIDRRLNFEPARQAMVRYWEEKSAGYPRDFLDFINQRLEVK